MVDMGEPILRAEDVPTRLAGNKGESVVAAELLVDGVSWNVTCVSMGNPHCITFGTKGGQVRVCFSFGTICKGDSVMVRSSFVVFCFFFAS